MGFFSKLKEGLTKTRDNIVSGIDSVFSGFSSIDDDFYDELEETLIMGDIGVVATEEILDDLKNKVKENKIKNPADCKQLLIDSIKEKMNLGENAYEFENRQSIVMLIGVNGVGKTTSVGKLAGLLKAQNKKVIMAAADTFRAAAIEQLTEWSNRTGADIIAQSEGSDPAAVIYDSIAACKARKADVLHQKVHLPGNQSLHICLSRTERYRIWWNQRIFRPDALPHTDRTGCGTALPSVHGRKF